MGRRPKHGGLKRSDAMVRNKTLQNLVYLSDAIMDETIHGEKRELYNELLRRAEVDIEREKAEMIKEGFSNPTIVSDCYDRPADLMINYLNADDVMKVLGCNRRTAIDYLITLRRIHVWYTFSGGSTLILADKV